jgi:hypothetical protein
MDRRTATVANIRPAPLFFIDLLNKIKIKYGYYLCRCNAVILLQEFDSHQDNCPFSPRSRQKSDKNTSVKH